MPKPSFGERLRYQLDSIFSRGTVALIRLLALASLGIIIVISLVVKLAGLASDIGLLKRMWIALMRTLDAGTVGGDEGEWPYLFAMLAVTLGGIFIINSLIGILTTGLEGRLDSLRKGRSKVAESGHAVILGWSPLVFPIISDCLPPATQPSPERTLMLGWNERAPTIVAELDHYVPPGSQSAIGWSAWCWRRHPRTRPSMPCSPIYST